MHLSSDEIDAAVDALLTSEGELRAGSLLARLGLVPARARKFSAKALGAAVTASPASAKAALEQAMRRADSLGLAARFSPQASDPLLNLIEACHRMPVVDDVQPDLFAQREVDRLRRELHLALLDWRSEDAAKALAALQHEADADPSAVASYRLLLKAQADLADWLEDPATALAHAHDGLSAVALACFGREAHRYLRPLRLALAEAMSTIPFDPQHPELHVSRLWTLLDDPARARASIEAEQTWRHCAQRLPLHGAICERLGDNMAALADWCELCFVAPAVAEARVTDSALLSTRFEDFIDLDPELPIDAFPAWLALCGALRPALPDTADDRRGARLLEIALALRQHPNRLDLRQRLREQSPNLLHHFLQQR